MAQSERRSPKGVLATAGLILGPLAAGAVLTLTLDPDNPAVTRTAAVALWMAIWWITEAVPLAATALLPIVLFPALGVLSGGEIAAQYFDPIICLFLGGFMIALAMQRWNLHKRIALWILLLIGGGPRRVLLGAMIATAFLSMWISNTAASMMMVAIMLAIILELEEELGTERVARFATGLLLGVAYAASIGGIATLVGTPTNLSFARIFKVQFPEAPSISFATWFAFASPISLVLLAITWGFLSLIFVRSSDGISLNRRTLHEQYRSLGPMKFAELVVLIDFALLIALWLTRGSASKWGWSQLFNEPGYLNDGTAALAMALLLFMIPARNKEKSRVLDWETAARLPWGIVLLLGGGFALATGFSESGLSAWIGDQMAGGGDLQPAILVASVCTILTFLTELTSNTATTEMALPVLASVAIGIGCHPLLLMIPATLSCSCAFMMPVATPPNAIVFGTGRLQIGDMVKTGVVLNLIGIVVIVTGVLLLGPAILDLDFTSVPAWAAPSQVDPPVGL